MHRLHVRGRIPAIPAEPSTTVTTGHAARVPPPTAHALRVVRDLCWQTRAWGACRPAWRPLACLPTPTFSPPELIVERVMARVAWEAVGAEGQLVNRPHHSTPMRVQMTHAAQIWSRAPRPPPPLPPLHGLWSRMPPLLWGGCGGFGVLGLRSHFGSSHFGSSLGSRLNVKIVPHKGGQRHLREV